MSLQRSALVRGPAIVTTTLTTLRTLYTRSDIEIRSAPAWAAVTTSMYGQVDKAITDRVVQVELDVWGSWENLDLLFPSYALAPQAGASIFGTSDVSWAITGRNGDKITLGNAQITKLSDLQLGVDGELFAKFTLTALLKNNTAPEASNAYYTVATAASYSDNAFAKTNYKRSRVTGAWGAITGFDSIVPQAGVKIGWALDAKPLRVDGLGTVDYTIGENVLIGTAECIPIQPTMAQLEAQAAAQGVAMGTLLSNVAIADLVWTAAAGAPVITLKNAGITEHGYVFGAEPLRQGKVVWTTTRGFTTGSPQAVATVA